LIIPDTYDLLPIDVTDFEIVKHSESGKFGPPQLLEEHPIAVGDVTSILAISDGYLFTISSAHDSGIQMFERTPADISAAIMVNQESFCSTMVGGTLSYKFTVTNNGPGRYHAANWCNPDQHNPGFLYSW
jgi:hypothetical protein